MSAADAINALGEIGIEAVPTGKLWKARCPFCDGLPGAIVGSIVEANNPCTLVLSARGGKWHCFGTCMRAWTNEELVKAIRS